MAAAVGVAVLFGVVWSDVLGYHDATLSPYDRHAELARIGERFAGDGPALMTEFEPYGPRWFLRRMDSEGAAELRTRPVPLVGGGLLAKGLSADIDAFAYKGLNDYRTLVLRRSPVASRPPSTFRPLWRGHWYEVWQRDRARPRCARTSASGRRSIPGRSRAAARWSTVWLGRRGRGARWSRRSHRRPVVGAARQ